MGKSIRTRKRSYGDPKCKTERGFSNGSLIEAKDQENRNFEWSFGV